MNNEQKIIELLTDIKSLLQDRFEPVKVNAPRREQIKVPYQDIADLYHEILPELPQVKSLTPARKGYIKSLWCDQLPEMSNWSNFFDYIRGSDFLMGKSPKIEGRKQFVANLEWITKPANFLKILEAHYHG